MYDCEKYIELIRSRLSDYRFNHSLCVAEKARELALKYGENPEKAYLAGILHDITKEEPPEAQLEIIKKAGFEFSESELGNINIYHQASGAAYVKTELSIDDEEILSGIRYHTTGRADMTVFEMIIYLADFTSADRSYPDVDIMRSKTDDGLFDGMLYSLSHTIKDVVSKQRQLHPDTLFCYNWVIGNMKKER